MSSQMGAQGRVRLKMKPPFYLKSMDAPRIFSKSNHRRMFSCLKASSRAPRVCLKPTLEWALPWDSQMILLKADSGQKLGVLGLSCHSQHMGQRDLDGSLSQSRALWASRSWVRRSFMASFGQVPGSMWAVYTQSQHVLYVQYCCCVSCFPQTESMAF